MTQREYQEVHELLKALCAIPAPSHFEQARAEYCCNYLQKAGFGQAFIDEALNVICPWNCENSDRITVFAAHTDTVFPDTEPMPYYECDGKACCPGVGDDTASLAVMLVAAKHWKEQGVVPEQGIVFVCNSCEEGLGNLKGIRALMARYAGRVARLITFDSTLDIMVTGCVGSHRYRVKVETEGGHSFNRFGNENAIANLAAIIQKIYAIEVPVIGDSKTTYNVGTIEGGTSVNTIAQSAEMLCEYRSDNADCLQEMQRKFEAIFEEAQKPGVQVQVTKVGDRPCARGVQEDALQKLICRCRQVIAEKIPDPIRYHTGSTDCNIPMSLGIPAVAVGVYRGDQSHTRQEWVELESLRTGLDIAVDLIGAFLFAQ